MATFWTKKKNFHKTYYHFGDFELTKKKHELSSTSRTGNWKASNRYDYSFETVKTVNTIRRVWSPLRGCYFWIHLVVLFVNDDERHCVRPHSVQNSADSIYYIIEWYEARPSHWRLDTNTTFTNTHMRTAQFWCRCNACISLNFHFSFVCWVGTTVEWLSHVETKQVLWNRLLRAIVAI